MSDQPQKSWWSPISVMLTTSVLFGLYVLGIGPVYWYVNEARTTFLTDSAVDVLLVIYSPLIWIGGNVEHVGKAFEWYISFWVP